MKQDLGNKHINLISMPRQSAIMHRNFKETKGLIKSAEYGEVGKKYDGSEYIEPPVELDVKESEEYTEYSNEGKALPKSISSIEKKRSKFVEDVFQNGHATIWGMRKMDGASSVVIHMKSSQYARKKKGKGHKQ